MEGRDGGAAERLRNLSIELVGLPPEARAALDDALARIGTAFEGHTVVPPPHQAEEDGCVITDARGLIVEANRAAGVLLRTRPEFLVGMPFPFFLAEGHWRAVYSVLNRARDGKPEPICGWRVRLRPVRRGEEAIALVTMVPAPEEGGPRRLRWVLRDGGAVAWA